MKLVNRDSDYALAVLVYLARSGPANRIPANQLATTLAMPHGFLRKILRTLSANGIVSSTRGVGGGFRIAIDPDQITALEIIEIFQGQVHSTECAVRRYVCPRRHRCPVRDAMANVEANLAEHLNKITIGALAGQNRQTDEER